MKILAFDTATGATTAALIDTITGAEFEARDDPAAGGRPGHAQKLLTLCEQVLSQAGLALAEVDRLAVGVGPGTFTGLRIGIATAHALAQSTGVPLVGVSTLDSLVAGARERAGGLRVDGQGSYVLAVIDARRGEAFVGDGAQLPPAVVKPEALPALVTSRAGLVAVGDGAIKFRETLETAGALVPTDSSPLHLVSARYHCLIAANIEPGLPTDVQPQYLRVPDAELAHGS